MREIKYYKGKQITKDIMAIFLDFAKERFTPEVFEDYFSHLTDIEQYAQAHEVDVEDEHMILGTDWIFCYHIAGKEMVLSDWISREASSDKFAQSLEMYKVIKSVLVNSNAELFSAYLRHSTSYPFYQSFIRRGIIEEFMDTPFIDICSDETYAKIASKFDIYDESLAEMLEKGRISEEEKDYIYHDVTFEIGKKYQKKKED